MQELRQSTEIKVRVGSAVDATDGVTPETGLTLGAADQAELLKHNGVATVDISAATFAAVTAVDGWYDLTLTTSHTDTLGQLTVVIQDTSLMAPIFRDFMVVTANYWDSKYSTDKLEVDIAQTLGTAITVNGAGQIEVDVTKLNASAQTLLDLKDFADTGYDPATNKVQGVVLVDTTATNSDLVSAAAVVNEWETQSQADPTGFHVNVMEVNGTGQTANDNSADINSILANTNELQTDWANGGRLDLIIDACALEATVAALNNISTVDLATALSNIKLDHLIAVADGDDPVDGSIIAMLAASDGDWSGFAIADDSLEAIRDRGDAAWTTGAGGTPPTTLQNTTIATLATQVSFTLTAGSADDDAYNGCIVVVEDSATATQKCIGRVLNYTGASKTITLEADPGVFTMAAGDTIDVIAVELTWSAATKALTDKSGFALSAAGIDAFLDEVIGDAVHATPNSVGAMLHAVYCRFMQKRTATDTVEKAYKLDDITELKAFTLDDVSGMSSRT